MREQFPVFDLHCDTAVELSKQKKSLAANDLHIDLERAGRLLTHHQFYAFCCVYDLGGLPLPQKLAESRFSPPCPISIPSFLTMPPASGFAAMWRI